MEDHEKKHFKEMVSVIGALEKENTPDAQYRALEIAEGLEEGDFRDRMVRAAAAKLVFLLEEEGGPALDEAQQIEKEYFSKDEPEELAKAA